MTTARELILLSPYRLPAKDSLMLSDEDVSAFLNGYTALWHPLAAHGAIDPPRICSPYDYENPVAGHVYAVPESPPMFLPDDWDQRVIDAGAVAFRSSPDRAATISNLKEAMRDFLDRQKQTSPPSSTESAPPGVADPDDRDIATGMEGQEGPISLEPPQTPSPVEPEAAAVKLDHAALFDLPPEKFRPFFGIGFGFLHVVALFEAMDHENLLSYPDFWRDVQQAIEAIDQDDAVRGHLLSAAERLMSAREALYPVTVYLVDICLLDEQNLAAELPAAHRVGQPINVVTSATVLEQLGREQPEKLSAVRERALVDQLEVCIGSHTEREESLLPMESQLWNLLKGLNSARQQLGIDIRVFARKRFGVHPQLPLLLTSAGIQKAVLLSFDDSSMPTYRTTVVSWPAANGNQIEAFTRTPYRADSPNTYFHAAYYLHQTIAQDSSATLALLHKGTPACVWYEDWLELSQFAPVLGKWTTLSTYLSEVMAGEQIYTSSADEFHADYLTERTEGQKEHPVSWFARHTRQRRRLDTIWSLAGVQRGLAGKADPLRLEKCLAEVEDKLESGAEVSDELANLQNEVCRAVCDRLQSRAADNQPGIMVLNPCSFARRVAIEVDDVKGPLPIAGPLKACQLDGGSAKLVVEVPAFGFAWVPRQGPPGTAPQPSKMRLADDRHVRNEFFEAEIDPATGGLRGIWDPRMRNSRIGQQLVYNPGSIVKASSIKATSTGPALGEVVSEGAILDEQEKVLCKFRQRFRAWLGRPLLEMRIELYPEHEPVGYPWHAYYGARFAWRDERAMLLRGVNGTGYITSHTRPESPDYLEWRWGRQNTVLFPGGLPFQQRHGARMLDVILLPQGEKCHTFDLALGLDREHPMQSAMGGISPVAWIPVAKGPPHVGNAGWLFHLDAPNLLVSSFRPADDGADAVIARMLECAAHGGQAELRCVRNPTRAYLLDSRQQQLREASIVGDAAVFDVSAGDLVQLRVEFQ